MSEIDPKLSRLYREASAEEPPAALDAAILAAARKQAAKSRRLHGAQGREQSRRQGRSFWSRWIAPAGAIATLALGVSLALLVEREQPGTADGTSVRPIPPRPQGWPPAPVPDAAKAKADDGAAAEAAAKKEAPAAAPAQAPEPLAPARAPEPLAPAEAPEAIAPARAPEPLAPAQAPAATMSAPPAPRPAEPAPPAAEAFPAERRAKSAAPASTAPATAAPSSAVPKAATESNAAGDSASGGPGAGAPAAPAAAGGLSPLRQQAIARSPEAWLDEISRLRREGRENEAAEQLAEFRKAYPAYAVPENLLK